VLFVVARLIHEFGGDWSSVVAVIPSLKALGRKSTILPGFLGKLLTYSLAMLPRWVKVKIMGKVMQGMVSR
jgi:hypothetical protein